MYELLKNEELPEINSQGYYFKHKKSGARLAVLENEDRNKVFCVSFRTPPNDDTGVAHIIEHSVLMGSERFPLKDPFNKLANSSLNTYLNAMTYPDKTMYPIASCNDKDFKNLMGVYTDAVFAPNVLKDDRAFRQEGWSYELLSEDDEFKYNGVVYNEMKGAYSSGDRVTYKEMMSALLPDTNYAFESGGKPEAITDLTYEEFVGFYNKLYHPSNSYIYLYGDADMEERLLWLDKEYLCKYDAIDVSDTMPLWQEPFDGLREKRCTYSIMENEDEKDRTNLGFAVGFDKYFEDTQLNIAFQLISYALVEAPGSPLEKALYDAGIGKFVAGDVDGMRQGYFEVVANNTNEDRKDEFYRIIMDTLKSVVENGLDKKTLRAGLHNMEFKYREQDFGRWPGGLLICIGMMQSWLYDDDMVFDYYKLNEVFAKLRELIDTDYYEKLVEKYFLNNPHKVLITVAPEQGLIGKEEKALKDKLLAYQKGLTDEEKQEIVKKTKELKAYQDEEDTPWALATLPRLLREDI
ncbi:MAG: insulinase family protein, partial [Lachnospiraceae bacterium]|nr:insulinase family protein [Lachnospiraceae bacterium]